MGAKTMNLKIPIWLWLFAAGVLGLLLWKTRENVMQANAEAEKQASARTIANWRLPFDEKITTEIGLLQNIISALEKKNAPPEKKDDKP
jgi:hypothetical protein